MNRFSCIFAMKERNLLFAGTFVSFGKELLTEGIRLTIADRRESQLLTYRKK